MACPSRRAALLAGLAAWTVFAAPAARALSLSPADATSIRLETSVGLLVLTFLAIKPPNLDGDEDRAALEFDLSGLTGTVASAALESYWVDIDPAPPDGVIDVRTYTGDGAVTIADFSAGSFFTSVVHNAAGGTVGDVFLSIDVTAAVQDALTGGQTYLGFLLLAGSGDRYNGAGLIGVPEPVLQVNLVPEPGSAWLLAALALAPGLRPRR